MPNRMAPSQLAAAPCHTCTTTHILRLECRVHYTNACTLAGLANGAVPCIHAVPEHARRSPLPAPILRQRLAQLGQHKQAYVVLHRQREVHVAQRQDAEGARHGGGAQVVHVADDAGGRDDAVGRARKQVHRDVQQPVVVCAGRQRGRQEVVEERGRQSFGRKREPQDGRRGSRSGCTGAAAAAAPAMLGGRSVP